MSEVVDVTLSKSAKGLDPTRHSAVLFRPVGGVTKEGNKGGGSSGSTVKAKLGKKELVLIWVILD